MRLLHPSPLHLESCGAGDPPLVLVHGFGAHGHFWRKWVPTLSQSHETHVVDLMGFGKADTPPWADYSPFAQARHLVELIRRIDGAPPVLIGHSLGAGVSLAAALLLRDEGRAVPLGGLVLVSAAVYPQKFPFYLTLARTPLLGLLFLLGRPPEWLLRKGIRGIVDDPATVDSEQVRGYLEPLGTLARRRAILRAARQLDLDQARTLAERLPELDLPSLLMWGENDRIVPTELGVRLSRALRHSELVVLPGVGHLPPEEAPERSLRPVMDFLGKLRETGGGTSP